MNCICNEYIINLFASIKLEEGYKLILGSSFKITLSL
jgi:hypothetical protein